MNVPSPLTARCLFALLLLMMMAVAVGISGGPADPLRAVTGPATSFVQSECTAPASLNERDPCAPTSAGIWDGGQASADSAADPQECALPTGVDGQAAAVLLGACESYWAPVPSLALSRLDRPPRLG